jgi:hypothetical protein
MPRTRLPFLRALRWLRLKQPPATPRQATMTGWPWLAR